MQHSMRPSCSRHKYGPLQKLTYGEIYLQTLKAALTELNHFTIRSTTNQKVISQQQTLQGVEIKHIDTWNSRQQTQGGINKIEKKAVIHNSDKAISQRGALPSLNFGFTLLIDGAAYCRGCVQEFYIITAWDMILDMLPQKLHNALNKNLKTLSIRATRIYSFHKPNSNPRSPRRAPLTS